MSSPRLLLASASPRRKQLLEQLGFAFEVLNGSEIDETPRPDEDPEEYVVRMAAGKWLYSAQKATQQFGPSGWVVLTADTTVALGNRIFGKPETADEARSMLQALSGQTHSVLTAFSVGRERGRESITQTVTSYVTFKTLTPGEIDAYVTSGEPFGKAGAYGIQGRAGAFVRWLEGSYSAVVGLPLCEVAEALHALGVTAHAKTP